MLLKLEIPAGVYGNGTDYQSMGRWHKANLVRWHSGIMLPIKGWQKFIPDQLDGRPSDIHQYRDGQDRRFGIGTHSKLYAYTPAKVLEDITPAGYVVGRADRENTYGYGIGLYSASNYGVSTPDTASFLPPTNWTLDNFGTFLVGCANTDGTLYYWDGVTATAEIMSGSPTSNRAMAVTEERFVFALGAGGSNSLVQWSDQEDFTTWTPAPTNQAGDFDLQTTGSILNAVKVRGQLLILTTADAHVATYSGPPFIYGFERVGTGCGALGPQASAATDSFAAWMGRSGFFIYDGFVKPLSSEVFDYVYGSINLAQSEKTAAFNNTVYGELWWFYPSATSIENDRYVIWNYRENTWSTGFLSRTCGTDDGVYDNPLMVSADGYIYSHELGFNWDGAKPYAETGPIELGAGDSVYMAKYLYPDERTQGDVTATFRTRFYPNGPEYSHGPYSMAAPTDLRFTGRQVVMRVDGLVPTDWRFGVPRIDVAAGGTR